MPAVIAHSLFARRVFTLCHKTGISIPNRDAALIGAQGPDIFFYHRILPWQPGNSFAKQGSKLHKISPAKLFEGFRRSLSGIDSRKEIQLSYVEGFICHYALDRAAHPFVLYWQDKLREEDPTYGKRSHSYHFRIESALDTIILRRETGRLIRDYKLKETIPSDHDEIYAAIGHLYKPIFQDLLGIPEAQEEHLALAPKDMRQAMILMTDRLQLRRSLLHPLEKISGQGHIGTSLLRPTDTSDWDYANERHLPWCNPFDKSYQSTDSFFDLYDLAAADAVDMIREFSEALSTGKSMQEITQDRGFSSDLPGVYEG